MEESLAGQQKLRGLDLRYGLHYSLKHFLLPSFILSWNVEINVFISFVFSARNFMIRYIE